MSEHRWTWARIEADPYRRNNCVIFDDRGEEIARVADAEHAPLLAAAPALLAACECAEVIFDTKCANRETWRLTHDQLKAAIAKARHRGREERA